MVITAFLSPMRRPMTSDEDTFWGGRNTKFSSEPQRVWFERMRDKGWTVPHWPKEYGGGGLDPEQAKIVRQEMAAEVPGGETGLLVRDYKGKDADQPVYKVDTRLLAERGTQHLDAQRESSPRQAHIL